MSPLNSRLGRLAQELQKAGVDAYFAWHLLTIQYLQGYGEEPGRRFMTLGVHKSGEVTMICPALAEAQARRSGVESIRPWKDGQDPLDLYRNLADEWGIKAGIIALDDETPATMLLSMQQALPAALYRTGGQLLANLTREKDVAELASLKKAAAIADKAFPIVLEQLKPGVTEATMTEALASTMSKLGGIPTFAVVAAGRNGAEPHHNSDDTIIEDGDVVVMDFGCRVNGYHSDITRTVCCGKASDDAKRVYQTVHSAHMKAREAIRPNTPATDVDRAARGVISEAGYGEYFIHRTGHGIGLRIHEEPFIIEGNGHLLRPYECFSIEPGIYFQGKFGIRIENIVAVTPEGYESLNEDPSPEILEIA